jgi:hypothetical protein
MDIIGPASRHKGNTFILYIAMLVLFSLWCVYDGYFNSEFITQHTENGQRDGSLQFNRLSPPVMILAAAGLAVWLYRSRGSSVVAGDTALTLTEGLTVPYDSIQQIDKTHFEKKGFFVITYKTDGDREAIVRLDDRHYDNLGPILDRLVEKIT